MKPLLSDAGLRLVTGDRAHLDWAGERLGGIAWPADSCSLAIEDDQGPRGVVVYNYFTETSCCAHIATNGRRNWATRAMLFGIFALPFLHHRLNRVTLPISVRNVPAQILALKLGFQFDGRLRNAQSDGDEVLFGMLRDDCFWIKDS